ncbi:MAG: sulfatase-like hydrolase/transferase, partial [Trueperaceae bacterium]|nr:sulfatase-like hydrolase/transferase [Trueperaceae bacterium]
MSDAHHERPRRPNLLFVITDQQRADTVAPEGPCATPHLQALAAEGTRFERCYAPNPICSPTRASLFTGLYPHAHGITDVTHAVDATQADLAPGVPFWPRRLQAAGYRTGYFGKWHVERSERLEDFGFDTYETELRLTGVQGHEGPLSPRIAVQQEGYREFLLAGVHDGAAAEVPEARLVDLGIGFLEAATREPERPWALVVATEAPHDPYLAPRELFDRIDLAQVRLPASFRDDLADRPAVYRRIRSAWDGLSEDEVKVAIACYHATCASLDDQVGRLLAALDASGQADGTVVAFCSDHGDYLGAHGLFLKGVPAFEEAYRVPLLLRGPGVPAGRTVAAPVGLIDLGPTLVRLLLGEAYAGHGRDLAPHLGDGGAATGGEAFAEFHGQRLRYTQRVLWRDRWKYVFNGFAEDELYDLEAEAFGVV